MCDGGVGGDPEEEAFLTKAKRVTPGRPKANTFFGIMTCNARVVGQHLHFVNQSTILLDQVIDRSRGWDTVRRFLYQISFIRECASSKRQQAVVEWSRKDLAPLLSS